MLTQLDRQGARIFQWAYELLLDRFGVAVGTFRFAFLLGGLGALELLSRSFFVVPASSPAMLLAKQSAGALALFVGAWMMYGRMHVVEENGLQREGRLRRLNAKVRQQKRIELVLLRYVILLVVLVCAILPDSLYGHLDSLITLVAIWMYQMSRLVVVRARRVPHAVRRAIPQVA